MYYSTQYIAFHIGAVPANLESVPHITNDTAYVLHLKTVYNSVRNPFTFHTQF